MFPFDDVIMIIYIRILVYDVVFFISTHIAFSLSNESDTGGIALVLRHTTWCQLNIIIKLFFILLYEIIPKIVDCIPNWLMGPNLGQLTL